MVFRRRRYLVFVRRIRAIMIIQKGVKMFLAKQKLKYLKGKKELELYSKALREKLEHERQAKDEEEKKQRRDRLQKKLELEFKQKEHAKYLHSSIGPNRPYMAKVKTPATSVVVQKNSTIPNNTGKVVQVTQNQKDTGSLSKKNSTDVLTNIYLKKQGTIIPRSKGAPTQGVNGNYIQKGSISKQNSFSSMIKGNLDISQTSDGESINYDSLYQIFSKNQKF